jgi:predicted transcriptional regulator
MNAKSQTIEIDEATAAQLKVRAAQRGMSVAEFVAELARLEGAPSPDDRDVVAELDRRWLEVEASGTTVANGEVVRWLQTWGTPEFKPWNER